MRKLSDVLRVKMESIPRKPPHWQEIVHIFPQVEHHAGVLFAWGDKIYNPSNIPISHQLEAHECTHSLQQKEIGTPEEWWQLYLISRSFRFAQELEAHRIELEAYNQIASRPFRRRYFNQVADRLASPLYGKLVTIRKAKDLLFEGRTIDE